MILTGSQRHWTGERGVLDRQRLRTHLVSNAKLPAVVLAPSPHLARAVRGQGEELPGGDTGNAVDAWDAYWAGAGRRRPVAQLPVGVASPRPESARRIDRQGVIDADRDQNDLGIAGERHCDRSDL